MDLANFKVFTQFLHISSNLQINNKSTNYKLFILWQYSKGD